MNDLEVLNIIAWASLQTNYSMKKGRIFNLGLKSTCILIYVASCGLDGCKQTELLKRFRIHSTNMVSNQNYLGRLLELGFVSRVRTMDRYFVCVATPAGLSASRKLLREIRKFDAGY